VDIAEQKAFFREHDNTVEQIKLKLQQLKECRGTILADEHALIGKAYRIHIGNYQELNKSFMKYFDLSFAIQFWRQDGEKDREIFIDELSRLLHNFLSSASTLIDHTRVVTERVLKDTEFFHEYENKKRVELAESELIQFVKKFRNYFSHIGITPILLTREIKQGEYLVNIAINKSKLHPDETIWNARSREFIKNISDKEPLRPIINAYCQKIKDFHIWYQGRFEEIFKSEFDEARTIQAEYNELVKKADFQREEARLAMNIESARRREETNRED
jgi:hypothetical protein